MKKGKREYASPEIIISLVEMEQGIAAGSATIIPDSSTNEIKYEWEDGTDTTGEIIWD
ncbi:hypothetical protein [Elizabethkingia anophelis]|uniref:hypothetical protein n=1 Tax=Elizabethkingia anophelis TaxID=1117645 RepID=UPI0029246FDB|nr:MAG: hypothetical protein PQ275_19740 [Elizabethkingia anophelis]